MKGAWVGVFMIVAFVAGAGIATIGTSPAGRITTITNDQTFWMTTTITNLRAGAALVNYSGSGNANSPPFTATTPTVLVTIAVSITSSNTALGTASWYLYQTSAVVPFDQGSVNGKSGTFTFYSYDLAVGSNYYVKVLSANADWSVVVTEAK